MTRSKKESTSERLLRIRDITCSRRLTMNPICTIIVAQPRTQEMNLAAKCSRACGVKRPICAKTHT
jgi:hypothetical protein